MGRGPSPILLCALAAVGIDLGGCARGQAPAADVPGPAPAAVEVHTLDLPDHPGISGAARAPGGAIVVVAERAQDLIDLGPSGEGEPRISPIEGLPQGADLESLAWLGPTQLAIGTERHRPFRRSDPVLIAQLTAGAARVEGEEEVSYAPWGMWAETNRGIEGLCAAGGALLAGVEDTLEVDGRRVAPLALKLAGQAGWSPFDLPLTTATGKLSSLECAPSADGRSLEALAIERHYGVSRVLTFTVPLSAAEGRRTLNPTVLVDLTQVGGPLPNFEGLVRLDDGRLWIVADNSSGEEVKPAAVWVVTLP